MKTTFKLNGETRSFDFIPNETLLSALREKAGLKSPKCGCERGDCGSCTIIIDGRSVKSCLILAVEVEGQQVTTLEGLMKNAKLTPLQDSFLKKNSFQCGFCAPGIVMAATDLLNHNPKPTEDEIKEGLGGNLCRCTGYTSIISAIKDIV